MWVGANLVGGMVCVRPHDIENGERDYGSATAARLDRYGLRQVCEVDVDPFVPALDHPDTQAAYLRRLAIRLGCPEEVAREGVMFAKRDNAWVVYAGWSPSSWGWTWAVGCTFEPEKLTTDRLLALVRAWRVADDG